MKHVTIYTDGACIGNPGPGGWAAILEYDGRRKTLTGGEKDTTNNRMELTAAIEALAALKQPCAVTLYTDSGYVRDGITRWIHAWKANGWRTAGKKPVKNQDLWTRLDALLARHQVDWRWVPGHTGNPMNEECDRLAVAEARRRL